MSAEALIFVGDALIDLDDIEVARYFAEECAMNIRFRDDPGIVAVKGVTPEDIKAIRDRVTELRMNRANP